MRRRKTGFLNTKRLYVISTEGSQTEPIYFTLFRPKREDEFRMKMLGNPRHKTSPLEVVDRLVQFEKREKPGPNTEYWAVIDRDSWSEETLRETNSIIRDKPNYHLALSNPCFEMWLYLHFRDNRCFSNRHDCQKQLKNIFPEYEKSNYDTQKLLPGILNAIQRAEALAGDASPDEPWPTKQGTHVFKLIEKLI